MFEGDIDQMFSCVSIIICASSRIRLYQCSIVYCLLFIVYRLMTGVIYSYPKFSHALNLPFSGHHSVLFNPDTDHIFLSYCLYCIHQGGGPYKCIIPLPNRHFRHLQHVLPNY